MGGTDRPLWERPVRWPAEGLPFDMQALRYVLKAAEQMSFSGAARALDMKVSSVSRDVRDFEGDLGISLFERSTWGVRLTDAGSRFLDDIIPILQMAAAVLQRAGAAGRVEEGTVRVGIITTLTGGFLRELITSYEGRSRATTGGPRSGAGRARSRTVARGCRISGEGGKPRSSLKARVILPPTKSTVGAMESEFGSQGKPQPNSAFNGRALALLWQIT